MGSEVLTQELVAGTSYSKQLAGASSRLVTGQRGEKELTPGRGCLPPTPQEGINSSSLPVAVGPLQQLNVPCLHSAACLLCLSVRTVL